MNFMKKNFNHSLFQPDTTVIVGLSGGPDSVALLHYLAKQQKKLGIKVIAAHLNHEWHKDSNRDVLFCEKFCEYLDVPFKSQKASSLKFTPKNDGSKESMARQQRRFFFEILAKQVETHSASNVVIALAHHKQDQLETFFIRLIRGTTISGLCCMKEQNGRYIRPMLQTDKAEISEYLDQNLLSYLQDPTNDSDEFLRNRIRKDLLPVLEKCDQRGPEKIIRSTKTLQDTEQFLEALTTETYQQVFVENILDLKKFIILDPFLQRRIVSLWLCKEAPQFTLTEKFIEEVIRFLRQPAGATHQLGTNWSITKKQNKAELKSSR
jgi:tRNA(Ile)-lysidine synthase